MAKFGAKLGLSSGNIGDWESGKALPSLFTLISIKEEFGVSSDWVLTGETSAVDQAAIEPDLQRMIEAYNLLDGESRQALKAYTAFLIKNRNLDILEETLKKTRASDPGHETEIIKEEKKVYLPVLGTVAAGMPIMADEFLEGFLPVPTKKIKKNTYIVRAKGESMIDAGIRDGDLIIISPQPTVEQGESALIKVDGDVTIKKFYRYDHEVRLKPANDKMKDIVITDLAKVKVLGKVVGVIPLEEANITMRQDFNGEEDQ
ncbi:phage repressor like transcriptional regulator, XRE family [Syntrophobotulus glycolicus DSM 8271]|uniref:Phage repressor like transcriptional regulator, XRE family n=2 Tax=Syntrophobotulus TaxID=51196 RepID=F0T0N8_SYNGF|nr:phage repressor like transcriptional regulator, XRE family [Syntrophobotulus glycolicus DSM 8271]